MENSMIKMTENKTKLDIQDFLPLFIIVGIGFFTGILFLVEKLRDKFTEKNHENMDGPPRYADLELNLNQEVPVHVDNNCPPTYDTATRDQNPPTYEFINRAFEEDPPAYEQIGIQTHATFVNHISEI